MENPRGYRADIRVTRYLLLWNGITDSIYGLEVNRKDERSSAVAANGNMEIQAQEKPKGSRATWHPVEGLALTLGASS